MLADARGRSPAASRHVSWVERILDASPVDAPATATAKAGPDGRFAVEGIAPGEYRVSAIAEDGARGSAGASVPIEGSRAEANPTLPGGAETLAGKVVHADGRPWTGLVLIQPAPDRGEAAMFVVTGESVPTKEDGTFRAVGLEPGAYVLSAVKDGLTRVMSKPIAVPHAGDLLLVVDAGLVERSGRVVADDDGKPVAGAWVYGGGQSGGAQLTISRTTTDSDGRFRLAISPSRGGWFATAPGFAPATSQSDSSSGDIEIRLVRAGKIVGRVTSGADAKPVAGIWVTSLSTGGREMPSLEPPAVTDAEGRYEIAEVVPGDVMVYAQGKSLVSAALGEVKREGYNPLVVRVESGKTTTVDLVVVPGVVAKGTVKDGDGRPVVGAVVRGEAQTDLVRLPRFLRGPDGLVASTGVDGSWSIDSLAPGTNVSFTATAPGFPDASQGPMLAVAGTPLQVDFRFPAPHFVVVRVIESESKAPVVGARVIAVRMKGDAESGQESTTWTTGADGRVRAGPLPSDEMGFHAEAEGFAPRWGWGQRSAAVLLPGASEVVVEIPKGGEIAGVVRFEDGTPAAGASLDARNSEESWGRRGDGQAETDGKFRLTGLAPGTYRVIATGTRDGKPMRGETKAEAGASNVSIVVAPVAPKEGSDVLVVRVLGPDGKPVPSASVTIGTENSQHTRDARDGTATFDDVPRGDVWIEVSRARSASGSALPYGSARVRPSGGTTEVRLPPESAIAGRVVGPDGKGVRGVRVEARSATFSRTDATAWSDETGAYRLGGLAEGAYAVTATVPPEFVAAPILQVSAPAADVTIALRAGAVAVIRVLDEAGKPVAGAHVSASPVERETSDSGERFRRSDRDVGGDTDGQGVCRLVGLDGDTVYSLRAGGPADREDVKDQRLDEWRPHDTTFRLERVFSVHGVVRDLEGRPVGDAYVSYQAGEHSGGGTPTDAEGRFVLRDLPAGEVALWAALKGNDASVPSAPGETPTPGASPRVTVAAGTRDAVLTLDVGLEISVAIENAETAWGSANLREEGSDRRPLTEYYSQGRCRFRGLRREATYSLWISVDAIGRSHYSAGLRAPAKLSVRLVEGKTIRGRLTSIQGLNGLSVTATDLARAITVAGRVEEDGAFEIRGLPEGAYAVTASGSTQDPAGTLWTGTAKDVVAGSSATIELRPFR
jgi:uncharacterized GH25 family protein